MYTREGFIIYAEGDLQNFPSIFNFFSKKHTLSYSGQGPPPLADMSAKCVSFFYDPPKLEDVNFIVSCYKLMTLEL